MIEHLSFATNRNQVIFMFIYFTYLLIFYTFLWKQITHEKTLCEWPWYQDIYIHPIVWSTNRLKHLNQIFSWCREEDAMLKVIIKQSVHRIENFNTSFFWNSCHDGIILGEGSSLTMLAKCLGTYLATLDLASHDLTHVWNNMHNMTHNM